MHNIGSGAIEEHFLQHNEWFNEVEEWVAL